MNNHKQIGDIGNYYGGLSIKTENNKFYWIIEAHNTDFDDISHWSEISKELYEELLKHTPCD